MFAGFVGIAQQFSPSCFHHASNGWRHDLPVAQPSPRNLQPEAGLLLIRRLPAHQTCHVRLHRRKAFHPSGKISTFRRLPRGIAKALRLLRQVAGGRRGKRGRKPTPVRANRLGEILRKMFNLAIRWRIRADNPAAGFARNAEAPRDRCLTTDEIGRLSAALDAHPNRCAADAVRRILLTGARRGEVLNARWDQFDLDAAVWIKPAATTKHRRLHRTPISASAAALLRTIRLRRSRPRLELGSQGEKQRFDFGEALDSTVLSDLEVD